MIDLSSIYRNPQIPAGYYFVKLIDINTEELGLTRPRIWVKLRIGPMYPPESGQHLHSIIHPTDRAIYFYKTFVSTFIIRGNRYHEAINHWGCIEVFDAQHGKTKYSAVKYVYQPLNIRLKVDEIEQDERDGRLSWDRSGATVQQVDVVS